MTFSAAPTVHIVDDEAAVADSVALLLRSVDLDARIYPDARSFLDAYQSNMRGCLVLDVRMPRMSGLELQQELSHRRCTLPVIFITGHGDVPMAVEAMRAGAVDFLQKPFNDNELIRRVQQALDQDARQCEFLRKRDELQKLWDALTPREREIAERLSNGQANKVVAMDLGISERTVELHRAHIMQKLEVRSLAQLVQLLVSLKGAQ
jgi:FixJ family two-component response regulator